MILKNEKFSNELNHLFEFIDGTLILEYPTPVLNTNYFILGFLLKKDTLIYRRLYNNLTSSTLELIQDAYVQTLGSNVMVAMKPGREVRFDGRFLKYVENAEIERQKLNGEKVTSEHIFLAIIKDEESTPATIFKKAGITYEMLFNKIKEDAQMKMEGKTSPSQMTIKSKPNGAVINISGGDPNEVMRVFNQVIGERDNSMEGRIKSNKESNIHQFCINLNELVEKGNIGPLIGRERETRDVIRILGRKKKNNVILVGSEGVGKTAIGEDIAYKIVHGEVPPFLLDKQILSLDMTALIAGTTLRGMFEERVKNIINEARASGKYILFIDNIGAAFADKGKNDYDISSMLSHSLENGEIQVIGTSDFKGFRTTFDHDPSLSRRFQKIIVETPTLEDSKKIMFGIKEEYEKYHKVKYTDEAIKACITLANNYIPERNLPDSAIDIMDEAGSYVSTSFGDIEGIKEKRKRIYELQNEISEYKKNDDYDTAENIEKEVKKIQMELLSLLKKIEKERDENPPIVGCDTILKIVSDKTGIPIDKMTADDKKNLSLIDERLKSEVIGQDEAITTICKALKRNRVGLHKGKCLFSAIFVGKSGIGKTLIAKKLAKEMFGDEKVLIRFDMSEYPDKSAVNKLIGSNPGYIGYEEGGQLTEAIKNRKHCVLLMDEIEKADPEIYNIFLQVLDEGFLTDNSGMKVDFKNVIVLFTSNIGTKAASEFGKGIGFNENKDENSRRILLKELKNKFPPEFLNRLDSVVYFNNLTDDNLKEIIKIEIGELQKRLKEINNYSLRFDDDVVEYIFNIVQKEREYGARPIKRAIQDEIEDKITDLMLEHDFLEGAVFETTAKDGNIVLTTK